MVEGPLMTDSRMSKDNARLIAAAPDLLAALEIGLASLNRHRQFTHFDDDCFTIISIETAITKATQ